MGLIHAHFLVPFALILTSDLDSLHFSTSHRSLRIHARFQRQQDVFLLPEWISTPARNRTLGIIACTPHFRDFGWIDG